VDAEEGKEHEHEEYEREEYEHEEETSSRADLDFIQLKSLFSLACRGEHPRLSL